MPDKEDSFLHADFSASSVLKNIRTMAASPAALRDWLIRHFPFIEGPRIDSFEPTFGQPGTLITIHGSNFSAVGSENIVTVGGHTSYVVSASSTELKAITALETETGPVKVTIGTHTATSAQTFRVLGYPSAGDGEDGPPILFAGAGNGGQGDVNPIGTVRLLVALTTPNDLAPTAAARTLVVDRWNEVVTYYNQASYGKTNIQIDVTTNWKTIDASSATLLGGTDNIAGDQVNRVTAFAAQGAVDEGFDLNDYVMMASVVFLNGTFIRARGGWAQQNFAYNNGLPPGDPNRININLSTTHDVNLLVIQETADWGRCAHEFGHNVVSAPSFTGDGTATLGEDVYSSDLIDPAAATAAEFELMGAHDTHPLFSGYHLDKLGYYSAAKVTEVQWDRNPFSQEFDIVAHGLAEDTDASRFHLVKIKIAEGLHYFLQVRQRPGTTAQVFDEQIPLGGAPNQGGLIVTAAIADVLNNNQQTRFLTLLHPDHVLKQNDTAEDPARALRITVVNGNVQARPLVCRVRVEWAQTVADDPAGAFDLRVEPWDSNWQTPDIWIDRAPFGSFDNPLDSEGRPTGNGDRPRPMEINHFHTRVHVSGAMGAANVKVTFYSVVPPGVGDNGTWTPLDSKSIANIMPNSFSDINCNWTPVVGQHTCLKVFASPQLGEISGGNNSAQENVFDFEAPTNSPALPVFIRAAVRNPLDERRMVNIALGGVPRGYTVHFPHSWVWLDPRAERHFDLVVIPPPLDYSSLRKQDLQSVAPVRLSGRLAREYHERQAPNGEPAGSRYYPIGGTLNRVRVVQKVGIELTQDREKNDGHSITLRGRITPAMAHQNVRVDLWDPEDRPRVLATRTDDEGRFDATFDLSYKPSLEADRQRWERTEDILKGRYFAQARTVGRNEVSTTESERLFIDL